MSLLRRRTSSVATRQRDERSHKAESPRKVYKYTVITCILDGYDSVREVGHAKSDVQYLLITDTRGLKSKTWDVRHVSDFPCLSGIPDVIGVINYVRYHPFKFACTEVAIYVDPCMRINKPLDKLYADFVESKSDIGVPLHPYRTTVYDELDAWHASGGISSAEVSAQTKLFSKTSFNKAVLFQSNVVVCRNVKTVEIIGEITWSFLKLCGVGCSSARIDHTVFSYVLATYFGGMKFFIFTQRLMQSSYMTWCKHRSDDPILLDEKCCVRPSVFGVCISPYVIEPF